METPTRVALWTRVSQGDEQTVENQLQVLREWALRRGYVVVREWAVDASAFSGAHVPQLRDALAAAQRGEFTILAAWSLDRLSRQGIEATLSLMSRFSRFGVQVISHQEPWTETTDLETRELLIAVTAWVAQQESKRRSERTKAGLERRRAQGLLVGGKPGRKDLKPRKRSGYFARYER